MALPNVSMFYHSCVYSTLITLDLHVLDISFLWHTAFTKCVCTWIIFGVLFRISIEASRASVMNKSHVNCNPLSLYPAFMMAVYRWHSNRPNIDFIRSLYNYQSGNPLHVEWHTGPQTNVLLPTSWFLFSLVWKKKKKFKGDRKNINQYSIQSYVIRAYEALRQA